MTTNPATGHWLAWIDVETTGLEPATGQLLEIGAIITDLRATDTIAGFHRVIDPGQIRITGRNLKAIRMHTANGLIDECLGQSPVLPEPIHPGTLADTLTDTMADPADLTGALNDLLGFLAEQADGIHLHPAGTNVDFDLRFLAFHQPATTPILDYRKLDLTSLRLAALANGADPYRHHTPGTHRVLDCLQRDMDDYRTLLDHLITTPTANPHPADDTTRCPICGPTDATDTKEAA